MNNLKITTEHEEFLKSIGINVDENTTEAEVRKPLSDLVAKEGYPELANDPLIELITVVQALVAVDTEVAPKKAAKKVKVLPAEDDNDRDGNGNKISEMIVEKKEKKPKAEVVKKEKKQALPSEGKVKLSRVAYDGALPEHVEKMTAFLKPLTDLGLECNYGKSCISVTLGVSDSKRSVVCVESIAFILDKIQCKVVFNGMNLLSKTEDLTELMSAHIDEAFVNRLIIKDNRYPFVKAVEEVEFPKLVNKELFGVMIEKIKNFDKKLRKNREKMEEIFDDKK